MEGFESPLELFRNTEEFYHTVDRASMAEELHSVSSSTLYHFMKRWEIDRDLYGESIKDNIRYMKQAAGDCSGSYDCLIKKIRRQN